MLGGGGCAIHYSLDPASPLQPALGHLRDWADHWANESDYNKTFTVMSKPEPGPSGT